MYSLFHLSFFSLCLKCLLIFFCIFPLFELVYHFLLISWILNTICLSMNFRFTVPQTFVSFFWTRPTDYYLLTKQLINSSVVPYITLRTVKLFFWNFHNYELADCMNIVWLVFWKERRKQSCGEFQAWHFVWIQPIVIIAMCRSATGLNVCMFRGFNQIYMFSSRS